MTNAIDPVGTEPSARFDTLADRPRRRLDSNRRDAVGFETLLAEATGRETRRLAAVPKGATSGLGIAQPRPRPMGALGANLGVVGSADFATYGTQALGGAATGGGSSAGAAVVAAAAEHLGVPYLWGGTDPVKGFDCSGLVQDAYRAVGVEMPKWSRHQATMGVEVATIEEALPGDVLTFGDPVNHVALYTGDGQMLHAPKTGDVVKIGAIDRPIASIRRIVSPNGQLATVGQTAAAPAATAVAPHSPGDAERLYGPLFESAGQRWDVDPALLAAVAQTESRFNPRATSPVGAQGLMQFMPATAAEMGVDAWDPASAIDGAARYLRTSLDQFESPELAIASYNAGRGAVSRYDGIPPYPETQNYVVKVMDAWRSRS